MKRDIGAALFIGGLFVVFFVFAAFVPETGLTGQVVATCDNGLCLELCDASAVSCSEEGHVCCPTRWEAGVCDLAVNCEQLLAYSEHQSLEVYQDSRREMPPDIQADWHRFFLPLVLVISILGYFVWKRKNPFW